MANAPMWLSALKKLVARDTVCANAEPAVFHGIA